MTEDEAKTKWCPFRRVLRVIHADNTYTHSVRDHDPADLNCIGSACMAWRATDNEAGPTPPDGHEPEYKPAGYCGLAGTPQ